jgi:hypothetical protein
VVPRAREDQQVEALAGVARWLAGTSMTPIEFQRLHEPVWRELELAAGLRRRDVIDSPPQGDKGTAVTDRPASPRSTAPPASTSSWPGCAPTR